MDGQIGAKDHGIARPASSSAERLVGIDALRAVAALTVLFAHLGIVPPELFGSESSGPLASARMVSNCLFNGPAAVIVFFVISGFCIHFPQARSGARSFDLSSFYIRRAIRIGIPVVPAILLQLAVGLPVLDMHKSVLWSIVCEAIYYLIYPALLIAGRAIGWAALVGVSFVVAVLLCLANLDALADQAYLYQGLGGSLTWIVGLPCWLLGCWLAERRQVFLVPSLRRIWAVRAAMLVAATLLRIVRFHIPLGLHLSPAWVANPFSLNAFALPLTAWIGLEMAMRRQSGPARWLEWVGRWSYSLYLVHEASTGLLKFAGIAEAPTEAYYLLRLVVALALSYIFYLIVERPSHRLAIGLSRRSRRPLMAVAEPTSP